MKIFSKLFWSIFSGVCLILMIGVLVVSDYAINNGSAAINMALNTKNTITINDPDAEPMDFFTSDYDWMTEENKYDRDTAVKLFEEDKSAIEAAEIEGAVLLWNKESALPLVGDEKVSLLSHSSVDLVECGSGSGYVTTQSMNGEDASVSMKSAFESRGFVVNPTLWDFYRTGAGSGNTYKRTSPEGQCTEWRTWKINEVPWSVYTNAVKDSFTSYNDVAIITISRTGGEYSDLHYNYNGASDFTGRFNVPSAGFENTSAEGGYLGLTDQEDELFQNVCALKEAGTFRKVVLLLNTPNPIQFQDLEDYYENLDAAMWIGQPGASGINAVCDLLKGEDLDGYPCVPSGRLADTFAYDNNSHPSTENDGNYRYSGDLSKLTNNNNHYNTYMVYQEGIYVGYRYFETRYEDEVMGRNNADSNKGAKHSNGAWDYSEEVAFPFGYGDSYTKFTYSGFQVSKSGDKYNVKVSVTNSGTFDGKEVVQVYLQKPYTTYDENNGIEKAAIELVGYAKTKLLRPGEKQDVVVEVEEESFKTFDAEEAETYIIEEGNYYLTVASDSHNAINNVISKKNAGNTDYILFGEYEKTNNQNLDKGFCEAIHLEKNFTKYSKSTQTGNEITTVLQNGDINKYQYRGDNEVTYLSRSDWEATYPATPQLVMNNDMAKDLAPNTVPSDEGYEMPNYSTFVSGATNEPDKANGDLVALDLYEAPLYPENHKDKHGMIYDDGLSFVDHWNKLWNQLMDQMTFDEQALMCANAYHQVNGAQSISLPSSRQENGPVGITKRGDFAVPDPKIKFYYFVAYPCASILAGSFNKDVAIDVGTHKSEDMLYLGYNGIYGPGVNMHRTPFGGRAFEYPSEDPYLAGKASYYESQGIESKGCMAYAKHFALNDTETNRRHVGVWSNEQATREIYLRAFELTFKEGGASATMNSFSRVGTKWNGGCYEFMTTILREEWGWDGINITDWMSDGPMSYVDAIMGGTNSFDGNGNASKYAPYRNNAAVCTKLRESARVITYNIIHSNAMNGQTLSSRTVSIIPWWMSAIKAIDNGVIALFAVSCVFTLLSFLLPIFTKEKDPKKILPMKKKSFVGFALSRFGIAIALGVIGIAAIVIVAVNPLIVDGNKNRKATRGANIVEPINSGDSGDSGDSGEGGSGKSNSGGGSTIPKDTGNLVDHLFEYEAGEFTGKSANSSGFQPADDPHFDPAKSVFFDTALSGNVCFRNITSNNTENKMVFKFNSNKTVECKMEITIASKYSNNAWSESALDAAVSIYNNDEFVSTSGVMIPGSSEEYKIGGNNYCNMQKVTIDLVIYEGANVLEINPTGGFLNVDCFNIKTSATISGFTPKYAVNADQCLEIRTNPTLTTKGKLLIKCNHSGCTSTQEFDLPVISTENGYKKESDTVYSLTILGKEFRFSTEGGSEVVERAVGTVHNEAKAGGTLCFGNIDPFLAASWMKDGNTDTPRTAAEIINATGDVVFENTDVEDTSSRMSMLFVSTREGANVNILDSKTNINNSNNYTGTNFFKTEYTYNLGVKATGEFTLTAGENKVSKMDMSVSNGYGLYFTFNGTSVKLKAMYSSATPSPVSGEAEITGTSTFANNAENIITLKLTRYDAETAIIKLFVNGAKVELSGTPSGANFSIVDGCLVISNMNAGMGQRVGFRPSLNKVVTLYSYSQSNQPETMVL